MSKRLALVGSGIKSISHLTIEAQTYIQQAEYVLYLINEPILEDWLKQNSKKCTSLEPIYFSCDKRELAYKKISIEILNFLQFYNFITVVIYGHPTVFSSPGLEAVKTAKKNNIETVIIPGISAEDCLFAELGIDPSESGCFTIEATNFLISNESLSKYSDLVIWQLGMIGNFTPIRSNKFRNYINLVQKKLLEIYSTRHKAILYEASLYPGIESKIIYFPIEKLNEQEVSTISTLYIPAEKGGDFNKEMLAKLKLLAEDII